MCPAATEAFMASLSSATEPIMISSLPSAVLQIGNGIPQYLDLERFQSLALANQFPNLPSPVAFGFQLICWFKDTILSFTSVILINQESKG